MKTFDYTINGVKYHVDVVSIKEDKAEVRVNGNSYEVELDRAFDIDQEAWAAATPKAAAPKATPVAPKSEESAPAAEAPKAAPAAGGKASGAPIKSPLPGVIIDILVSVGASVKKGQKIMVLEAMKMENEIKADRDGVISSIQINKGDTVQDGDTLVTIE